MIYIELLQPIGGADGTRTRDPGRDRLKYGSLIHYISVFYKVDI